MLFFVRTTHEEMLYEFGNSNCSDIPILKQAKAEYAKLQ